MAYNFPRVSRAEMASLIEQIHKIKEEADEVLQAFIDEEGTDRLLEETWDVIQACEGLLRKFSYTDVTEAKHAVIRKTEERGDYQVNG